VNRAELRQLADDRAADAQVLLAAGRWSGAYYLAGYAVECGLKACVLVHIERTGVIFVDKKYAEKCWTHDLEDLMEFAGLQSDLDLTTAADPAFERSWLDVKDWTETSRYRQTSEADARKMVAAVTDPAKGVLPWIRVRW
jgi:HEPN domain-containing protein